MEGRAWFVVVVIVTAIALSPWPSPVENPTPRDPVESPVEVVATEGMRLLSSDFVGAIEEIIGRDVDGPYFRYKGDKRSVLFHRDSVTYESREVDDGLSISVQLKFEGSNGAIPRGVDPLPHRTNYILGTDPTGWSVGVASYGVIKYEDIYDGIDLRYHVQDGILKYEFIVSPNAGPKDIGISYKGVDGLAIDPRSGDLLITASGVIIRDLAPVAYQVVQGSKRVVDCRYHLIDGFIVGFSCGGYDKTHPLVLDPGVEVGTYYGGEEYEFGLGIAKGPDGDVYVCGKTTSGDLPMTSKSYDDTLNDVYGDAFVARFDANLSTLRYATYIGGTEEDIAHDVLVHDDGRITVVGQTASSDFPTTLDALSRTYNGGLVDGFIVQLSANGSSLSYGSYYGGSDGDGFDTLALNTSNDLVIVGATRSADFPTTTGAYDTTHNGNSDITVLRLHDGNKTLAFSTLIGGSGNDGPDEVHLADNGTISIVGLTESADLPVTQGSLSTVLSGTSDGFIMMLNHNGTSLAMSTYFGGNAWDSVEGFCVSQDGSMWVCGWTTSTDMPVTAGAYQGAYAGEDDGYIAKLSSDGTKVSACTYLGGTTVDWCNGITLNSAGEPIVTVTHAPDTLELPSGSIRRTPSSISDNAIVWLDDGLGYVINGTFIEGEIRELLMINSSTNLTTVHILGYSSSLLLPIPDTAYADLPNGRSDSFVLGLSMGRTRSSPPSSPINVTAQAGNGTVSLDWDEPASDGSWPIRIYRLYYGTSQGSETFQYTVTDTEETISGLRNGDEYFFRIAAVNSKGEGPLSSRVSCVPFGIPTPPSEFTVHGSGGHVLLTWSPPTYNGGLDILGYRIYRGKDPDQVVPMLNLSTELLYADKDVVNGTAYYYRVQAYHSLADSPPSPVRMATPFGPPSVPLYLQAERGNGTVTLTWQQPERTGGLAVRSYRVYRGTTAESLAPITYVDTDTAYVDDGVFNGITYHYAVSAVNDAAEGPRTPPVQVTPSGTSHMPRRFLVSEGDGEITLSWEAPFYTGGSDVVAYWVYRGTSPDSVAFHALAGTDLSFTDVDLRNGRTYYYQVRAVTAAGPGDPTQVVVALPLGPPGPPEGLSVSTGDAVVELIWLAPRETGGSDVLFYRVYRGSGPEGMALHAEVVPGITRFTDTDLSPGLQLYYGVTAANPRLEGPLSEVLRVTVTGRPAHPENLTGSAGDGAVSLAWEPPSNTGGASLQGYAILAGESPDTMAVVANLGPVHAHTLVGLENGRSYYVAVRAINEWGEGPSSAFLRLVPLGLPGPPTGLTARAVKGSVTLTWLAPQEDGGSPVKGYLVLRGTSPGDLRVITQVGGMTSHVDAGLERGVTYHYAVVALTDVGEGGMSRVTSVETEGQATVESPEDLPAWMLFAGVVGAVMLGLAAATSTEVGRYELTLWALPLLVRLARDEVLNNRTRYAIIGIITDNPGIHFKAILKEFDIPAGAAVHHLSVLEKENYIRSVRDGRLKRFFLAGTRVPENLRMTPEEVREVVLELVRKRPGISQKEVIDELGVDRDTVGYHLREMVREGRLEDSKRGKYTVYRVR